VTTYGHGMYATPSSDGWQHGLREVNGYVAEVTVYGDGLAHGWNDYSITITDYLTGERWWIDGCAKYPTIREHGLSALRGGRRDGLSTYGYRRI
jgi:hypothetical protein